MRKTIETRFSGANHASLAQARGYADGYMRALLDADLIDQKHCSTLSKPNAGDSSTTANRANETYAA